MPSPLLEIQNLSVDFVSDNKTTKALQHISFTVNRGEMVAIVGESGSGKSVTSLSVLQLLPTPPAIYKKGKILLTTDSITIDMLQIKKEALRNIRGKQVAMIFQEPMTSLNPLLTCGSQVIEAILQHEKISAADAKQKTIALFEQVKLPDPQNIFDRYPHQLSGGQKQRVMIAMAMSCQPALLICDEPTTALDVTVQQNILSLIKDLQVQNNMGVIFITHDLNIVADIADKVIVLFKGKIVESGNTKNIFSNPQHPYTKALLSCRPTLHLHGGRLPVVSDFMDVNEEAEIVEKLSGKIWELNKPVITKEKTVSGNVLLSVENLKVYFPLKKTFLGKVLNYIKAIDEVSFEVMQGETLGLVGESGCGKSTLGRAILQLIKPTGGNITYKGIDLLTLENAALNVLRKDMQIIFQDPYSSLNPRIKIGDAIAEPLRVHGLIHSAKERKDCVMELLNKVDLKAEHYNRYPHEFSGGQRQRIVIARALALKPSFIICDESVSALDVSVQAQVLNLLNDLKKEFGFTAIFISHDLGVVRYISDRIMVMNKGKIEEIGEAEEIYHHPKKEYTKRLIKAIPKGIVA